MSMNPIIMTAEKAYLMGLIVGGGVIRNNNLIIKLPFRLWGEVVTNPQRAGQMATDILGHVRPLFSNVYNMAVSFTTDPEWQINSIGGLTANLINDLQAFGINVRGEIIKTANISQLRNYLNNVLFKRNFIAGIADSKGSLNANHRRFDANYQIISFEFAAANNYGIVFDICQILQEIGCYTDQLLWNHPNLHSSSDPYYSSWKKGFKVRVLIDSYVAAASFLFQAKLEGADENLANQDTTHTPIRCDHKGIDEHSVKTIHMDEDSQWLPPNIRSLHFLHNKHICAVMGCPVAPVHELEQYVDRAEYWINPFPIYHKDTYTNVHYKIRSTPIMNNRTYAIQPYTVSDLLSRVQNGQKFIWGNDTESGYPITIILQGIAWISQRTNGVTRNTRVSGNYLAYLNTEMNNGNLSNINVLRPDLLTPLFIHNDEYAMLIGPNNPTVYRRLITRYDRLRFSVREIEEGDLL